MTIEFKGSNAVIVAPPNLNPQFNPAAFSQLWMMKHLGLDQSDLVDGAILTPLLFQQPTKRFNLIVLQDRVQLNLSEQQEGEGEGELVARTILKVLDQFPSNTCHAGGLNFSWVVSWDGHQNTETSRRLFFGERNRLFRFFDATDACFGAYASKDFLGARLKVNANPLTTVAGDEINSTGVFFNFNLHKDLFHKDLTDDIRSEQLKNLLGRWQEARDEASRIMEHINAEFSS